MFFQILSFCLLATISKANISPTEEYPHRTNLDTDGNVMLYWYFTETHITFELHGNTIGWVGMGISPNGAMTGADIVIGWFKDGNAMVTDRHGVGNQFPPLDPNKNVELLVGMESNGWTLIKFRRQLAACEPNYDLPITTDTLRIIYAYGETDPDGDDVTAANNHHENRGVRSLILLELSGGGTKNFPEGERATHLTFDLLNDNFEIPAETTYYNCRLLKIPEFNQKQHVVKVSPVIQSGNEMFVHHILIYQCRGINETESLGTNTRCYGSNMPPDFKTCSFVIQAWAIGGEDIYYPSHAGFPLGEDDSPKYVVIETHYDNPNTKSGIRDSSGLRITYTSQLRKYDAGIIQSGHIVSGILHFIPPNDESFLSYGECSSQCLRQALNQSGQDRLNIFGVQLHSHLLGTGITVRHFRNTTELPYLSQDRSYNFNYQETRMLPKERQILLGDALQVVCDYKTQGVRQNITVGGLDTRKEMCLAFLYYYPKNSLAFCETAPIILFDYFGVHNITTNAPLFSVYTDIDDFVIVQPESLYGRNYGEYLNSLTWNNSTNQQLENDARFYPRIQNCRGLKNIPGVELIVAAPRIYTPYVEEGAVCSEIRTNNTNAVMETSTTDANVKITTGAGGAAVFYLSVWIYLFAFLFAVTVLR